MIELYCKISLLYVFIPEGLYSDPLSCMPDLSKCPCVVIHEESSPSSMLLSINSADHLVNLDHNF